MEDRKELTPSPTFPGRKGKSPMKSCLTTNKTANTWRTPTKVEPTKLLGNTKVMTTNQVRAVPNTRLTPTKKAKAALKTRLTPTKKALVQAVPSVRRSPRSLAKMNKTETTTTGKKTTTTKSKSIVRSIIFNTKERTNDKLLLKEVLSLNPFRDEKLWVDVANNLNEVLQPERPATLRTVRNRTNLILDKHAKDETVSKKASGVDEPYDELTHLLTEAAELKTAAEEEEESSDDAFKRVKNKKKKNERDAMREGARIREMAMVARKEPDGSDSSEIEIGSSDNEEDMGDSEGTQDQNSKIQNPTKKKKNKKSASKRKAGKDDPYLDVVRKRLDLDEQKQKLEQKREERMLRMQEGFLEMMQTTMRQMQGQQVSSVAADPQSGQNYFQL